MPLSSPTLPTVFTTPGPNGERSASYSGIGDITTVAKYLVLEEGQVRPAVTMVGGVGWPSGHASRLNPGLLLQDAIGTGSFNFITGVNLYKWVKPFLFYSNIWLNSPVNVFSLNGSDVPQNVRNRENVTFNLAAELPLNKQWVLLLEMYSNWNWSNPGTESLGFQSPPACWACCPGSNTSLPKNWPAPSVVLSIWWANTALRRSPRPLRCIIIFNRVWWPGREVCPYRGWMVLAILGHTSLATLIIHYQAGG